MKILASISLALAVALCSMPAEARQRNNLGPVIANKLAKYTPDGKPPTNGRDFWIASGKATAAGVQKVRQFVIENAKPRRR